MVGVGRIAGVSDFDVRQLDDTELRAAHSLFYTTIHRAPASDARWEYAARTYAPGRNFGAFRGGTMVGTAMSFESTMVVPGGAVLPMAAVSRVGVRADHRRRGVLTELMRAQLRDCVARGETFATLHASEPLIYPRFGYGVATGARNVRVATTDPVLRPDVPVTGEVRLAEPAEALELLPALYERIAVGRPGLMGRSPQWWQMGIHWQLCTDESPLLVAVHRGPDGDDGFATYSPDRPDDPRLGALLDVDDLHAANPGALAGLWRFLLSVDLVDEVKAWLRPLDEPLDHLVADRRRLRSYEEDEELWLRLVDVPAALRARAYDPYARPVVVEVRDAVLPENAGRYRLGPDGAERTTEAAALAMSVDVLAMLYLGNLSASTLAGLGRIEVLDPAAPAHVDRLLRTDRAAWCGTFF